jgi:hypothetical protein
MIRIGAAIKQSDPIAAAEAIGQYFDDFLISSL